MDRLQKLIKEKLCKKGEAYRKRRMAAGEKSSAYLSGRAVKVCKGQMSGRKKKTNEAEGDENNMVPNASLILPRGQEIILQAEEEDYKRGLLVTLEESGGYKIKYWYGDDVKVYPAEVVVDGVSIKPDAKEVDILFHPELKEAELTDPEEEKIKDMVKSLKKSSKGHAGQADYLSKLIRGSKKKTQENVAPNHDGKSSPYGSGYKELDIKKMSESLLDWFKKENWVRINTSGNISGDCGTMKKGKATTRCLPKKKAQSLTKAERKATVAKKVRGDKKGKQFVKNTKKAEYKKK